MNDAACDSHVSSSPSSGKGAMLKRNWIWHTVHVFFWLFCRTWLRVEIRGREHLDNTRGGLMLINHQSFLDPLLAAVRLSRPVSYLARDSLFRVPVLGWLLRSTYVIPISREAARGGSIRLAMERLDQGYLVGIFPEGTRSVGDDVQAFRPGFLALARRTKEPIYPVGIAGAGRTMPRGAWWIRPGRIVVVYGKPLTADEINRLNSDPDDKALTAMAKARVAECATLARNLLDGKT